MLDANDKNAIVDRLMQMRHDQTLNLRSDRSRRRECVLDCEKFTTA